MEELPAIIRLNLRHYEAMLKRDIDDEKRRQVESLMRDAKRQLARLSDPPGRKRAQG